MYAELLSTWEKYYNYIFVIERLHSVKVAFLFEKKNATHATNNTEYRAPVGVIKCMGYFEETVSHLFQLFPIKSKTPVYSTLLIFPTLMLVAGQNQVIQK